MNGDYAFETMTSPVTSDVATSGDGDGGSWNNHGGGSNGVPENSRTTSGRRKQRNPQRNNGK